MPFLSPMTPIPPTAGAVVVASDADRFEPSVLTVNGAGNLSVIDARGTQVDLVGVPAGHTVQFLVTGVLAAGLTASNIYRAF